jgi:hypothetical protein
MENKKEYIELRSEKARELIGQIPPRIIRTGIFVILIVILLLSAGSYYFKYSYTIKSRILLKNENNKIKGIIKLPANEITRVKPGQKVIVDLDVITYMPADKLVCKIDSVEKKIEITREGAKNTIYVNFTNPLITKNGRSIAFSDSIICNAEIITDKMSYIERIMIPAENSNH